MFLKLIKKIAIKLEKKSIPYMIIGGQAVLLYGEPRLTKDIDITLGIGADKLEIIIELAKSLKLSILVKDPETFVQKTMVLPVLDEKSGIRADLIFSNSAYEQSAMKRVNRITLEGLEINFASLEDVVIHKMVAGRPRDIEDVKSILLKNPAYDKKYIIKWLSDFDVSLDMNSVNEFIMLKKSLRQGTK